MSELIRHQLYEIFTMLYCGMAIMLIFDVRKRITVKFRGNKRISVFVYLFSWAAAAFMFHRFVYCASCGRITVAGLAAMALGMLLWKKTVCDIINS